MAVNHQMNRDLCATLIRGAIACRRWRPFATKCKTWSCHSSFSQPFSHYISFLFLCQGAFWFCFNLPLDLENTRRRISWLNLLSHAFPNLSRAVQLGLASALNRSCGLRLLP